MTTVSSSVLNQVARDWETQPFVDITVVDVAYGGSACPSDYPDIVMERVYYGSQSACDCRGIQIFGLRGMDELNVGENCNQKQLDKGCKQILPIMPFRMHKFNGKMICGRKGGEPFMTATRPNPLTSLCPAGYVACSANTTPDNTICYNSALTAADACPITSFEFVKELADCSDPSADWLDFEDGFTLCYSKNANSLPVTKIRVENLPCADPNFQIQLNSDPTEL